MEIDSGLTLYDMNKEAYKQEKPLDVIALRVKINQMWTDIMNRGNDHLYWMLLCKERDDYTVFIPLTLDGISEDMFEALNNRGQVLDVDKLEDGNYEIWIRDENQENFVYYLFDYSYGICKA